MEFVKKENLKLVNGGYLVSGKEDNPVNHFGFVNAQEQAHYLVSLAKAMEGKDFEGKKADSFKELQHKIAQEVYDNNKVDYGMSVEAPKRTTRDNLAKEAMEWMSYQTDKAVADEVTDAMQQFNVVKEFEEFGLYFDKGVVKLKDIYTIDQILEAVKKIQTQMLK